MVRYLHRLWYWWQGWDLLCHQVVFEYTNHKGQSNWRHVFPEKIWFGRTKWHSTPQWFLRAYDCDKKVYRDFALQDITRWM